MIRQRYEMLSFLLQSRIQAIRSRAFSTSTPSSLPRKGIRFSASNKRRSEAAPVEPLMELEGEQIASVSDHIKGIKSLRETRVSALSENTIISNAKNSSGNKDDSITVLDGSELDDFDAARGSQSAFMRLRGTRSVVRQRKPMEAPPELVDGLKRILMPHSLRRLTSDYDKLVKETGEFEKGQSIKVPAYDSRRSVAYLAFRTLPAFGVIKAAMQRVIEAGYVLPDHDDKSVLALDFGSGPGTASWAAWDAFQMKADGTRFEATFVESSLPMIDAATQLSDKVFETNWCRNILELARSVSKEGAARFDLVMATFALSDLPSDDARQIAIDLLWESVAPGGLLLLVERGTARGAHIVGKARKQILAGGSRFNTEKLRRTKQMSDFHNDDAVKGESRSVEEGILSKDLYKPKVVAPCGHEKPCPLLTIAESYGSDVDFNRMKKHEYCHFVQCTSRLLKATTDDNSVPLKMNYSYVAIQKLVNLEGEVRNSVDHLRVLRKPKRNIRHVVLDLCDPMEADGIRKQIVAHSNKEFYRTARKLEWGDLVPNIPNDRGVNKRLDGDIDFDEGEDEYYEDEEEEDELGTDDEEDPEEKRRTTVHGRFNRR